MLDVAFSDDHIDSLGSQYPSLRRIKPETHVAPIVGHARHVVRTPSTSPEAQVPSEQIVQISEPGVSLMEPGVHATQGVLCPGIALKVPLEHASQEFVVELYASPLPHVVHVERPSTVC